MSLCAVRKSSSGFTLIEIMVTIIIIGVIAAIAAPNFLGLLNRNRINEAAQQVEGALKEAQRQALRNGKPCTVGIDTSSKTISSTGTNRCLLTNRNLDSLIQLNANTTSIVFSGKGNITATQPTIVVSMPNGSNLRKCVVLDGLFATMRSKEYSEAIAAGATPVETKCNQ